MKDKVIVITGANGGLGSVLTEMLTSKGAIVVGLNKNEVDITKEQEVELFAQKVLQTYGHVDIWINNAGVWLPPERIVEVDMKKVRELFEVNVFGTIHGTRSSARLMANAGGTIVNIISTTAFDGMNGSSGSFYVASKYALRGFTNVLREELKSDGIKVIGVYPGGFKTELFKEKVPANFDQFMTAEYVAQCIVSNLENEDSKQELIIPRPGQTLPDRMV
ncbi:MAG: hypothetical protein RLY57_567 [Candidatus Parcubacteria bacterium]|jgi:NAD(P)-dependent dehydrogenase (short-subunit alcohol dehydrogenase family)